jgi:hypothetical protein
MPLVTQAHRDIRKSPPLEKGDIGGFLGAVMPIDIACIQRYTGNPPRPPFKKRGEKAMAPFGDGK